MSDLAEFYDGLGPVMDRDRAFFAEHPDIGSTQRDLHWSEEMVLSDLGIKTSRNRRVTVQAVVEGVRMRRFSRCELVFVDVDPGAVPPHELPPTHHLTGGGTKHHLYRLPPTYVPR